MSDKPDSLTEARALLATYEAALARSSGVPIDQVVTVHREYLAACGTIGAESPRLLAALCDELVLSRKVIGALDFLDSVHAETPILQPGELENASRVYEDARGALESWRDLQGDVPASTDEQFARIAATTKLIETATWYRDALAKLSGLAATRDAMIAAWATATPSALRIASDACRTAERHVGEMHEWLLAAARAMPERKVPDERA